VGVDPSALLVVAAVSAGVALAVVWLSALALVLLSRPPAPRGNGPGVALAPRPRALTHHAAAVLCLVAVAFIAVVGISVIAG
jgi:hypothetical protein